MAPGTGVRVVVRRWVSLSLLSLCVVPWCWTMGVLGVWLLAHDHRGVLADPYLSGSAGLASLSASQLVFLLCVAERVFPRADARLARGAPSVMGAIFLLSVLVLALAALTRGVVS